MRTSVSTDLLYASIQAGCSCFVRNRAGTVRALPTQRWLASTSSSVDRLADLLMLRQCTGSTIDLGCGPGRFIRALAARGIPAVGVDVSSAAVEIVTRGGGSALCQDIFAPLPSMGAWATVLLADGNVGIGGEPLRVLRRARELVSPDGVVLVELDPLTDGVRRHSLRLESDLGVSEWFPWADVGSAAAVQVASRAGLLVEDTVEVHGRTIARMRPS